MNLLAKQLIESYLLNEVRVRKPVDVDVLQNRLVNLYSQKNEEVPGSDFIKQHSDLLVSILFDFSKRFNGIELKGKVITTDEFEETYLRDLGWSVTSAELTKTVERPSGLVLKLEKKADNLPKKPKSLYHGAPFGLVDSILKKGLFTRSRPYESSYRYKEPRVYFTTRLNFRGLMRIISDRAEVEDMAIFKIDTEVFKKFRIFQDDTVERTTDDSSFPFSVYTRTHIPPRYLELIHRMKDGKILNL